MDDQPGSANSRKGNWWRSVKRLFRKNPQQRNSTSSNATSSTGSYQRPASDLGVSSDTASSSKKWQSAGHLGSSSTTPPRMELAVQRRLHGQLSVSHEALVRHQEPHTSLDPGASSPSECGASSSTGAAGGVSGDPMTHSTTSLQDFGPGSFRAELFRHIERRQRSSSEDDSSDQGLPRSPPNQHPKLAVSSSRGRGHHSSTCSDQSLFSLNSSEDSARPSTVGSIDSLFRDRENDGVGRAPMRLRHDAALHKRAVRPKSRMVPSQAHRRQWSTYMSNLPTTPEVNEDLYHSSQESLAAAITATSSLSLSHEECVQPLSVILETVECPRGSDGIGTSAVEAEPSISSRISSDAFESSYHKTSTPAMVSANVTSPTLGIAPAVWAREGHDRPAATSEGDRLAPLASYESVASMESAGTSPHGSSPGSPSMSSRFPFDAASRSRSSLNRIVAGHSLERRNVAGLPPPIPIKPSFFPSNSHRQQTLPKSPLSKSVNRVDRLRSSNDAIAPSLHLSSYCRSLSSHMGNSVDGSRDGSGGSRYDAHSPVSNQRNRTLPPNLRSKSSHWFSSEAPESPGGDVMWKSESEAAAFTAGCVSASSSTGGGDSFGAPPTMADSSTSTSTFTEDANVEPSAAPRTPRTVKTMSFDSKGFLVLVDHPVPEEDDINCAAGDRQHPQRIPAPEPTAIASALSRSSHEGLPVSKQQHHSILTSSTKDTSFTDDSVIVQKNTGITKDAENRDSALHRYRAHDQHSTVDQGHQDNVRHPCYHLVSQGSVDQSASLGRSILTQPTGPTSDDSNIYQCSSGSGAHSLGGSNECLSARGTAHLGAKSSDTLNGSIDSGVVVLSEDDATVTASHARQTAASSLLASRPSPPSLRRSLTVGTRTVPLSPSQCQDIIPGAATMSDVDSVASPVSHDESNSSEPELDRSDRPAWVSRVKENRRKRRERIEESLSLSSERCRKGSGSSTTANSTAPPRRHHSVAVAAPSSTIFSTGAREDGGLIACNNNPNPKNTQVSAPSDVSKRQSKVLELINNFQAMQQDTL